MRRLLVVSDLYLDPAEISGATQALPQLPALSQLLHLGVAGARHEDWRSGMAADLGAGTLGGFAPAQVAACAATGLAPGSAVCMADAVHMVAGMASVHLHPAGLLQLDADAVAELQFQFKREFGTRDQALWAVGDGLLLAAPEAAAADACDPAQMLGSPVEVIRSADVTRRALRRLGAEVEMWLPGLALNRNREHRGELPVSALWFWGGGQGVLPQVHALGTLEWEQAYGGNPWLHGIWRRLVDRAAMTARAWDDLGPSALIVVSAAHSSLPQLESDWFAPALSDLVAGRLSSLALRIGGQRWELGSRGRSNWWRRARWWRPRPWWQVLAA
jgi:hypothetical protein